MRQVLQRPRLLELTHEDSSEPQGVRLRGMREELQSTSGLQHARTHTHGREAAPVRSVWKGVLSEDAAQAAPKDPFWRATVSMPGLPESVRRPLQHDSTH